MNAIIRQLRKEAEATLPIYENWRLAVEEAEATLGNTAVLYVYEEPKHSVHRTLRHNSCPACVEKIDVQSGGMSG